MDKLTYRELALRILTEEGRPLSGGEIWEIAVTRGCDSLVQSVGKTPAATMSSILSTDGKKRVDSPFLPTNDRQVRYQLKVAVGGDGSAQTGTGDPEGRRPADEIKPQYTERNLHAFLTYFAKKTLNANTKTIEHTKSGKKEYGEWAHPDMVGCRFEFDEWHSAVTELRGVTFNTSVMLYAFELKKDLNLGNLRESFFQTVSNSSWANEAYLVAARVAKDERFRGELRRLCASFGIGVIELAVANPDDTAILCPCRQRTEIDWDMVNKLAGMNSDFGTFLQNVTKSVKFSEPVPAWFDPVLTCAALEQSISR